MSKRNLKYYLIPVGYISSVVTMEFFSNVLLVGLFLLAIVGSVVALIVLLLNHGQRTMQLRLTLVVLTLVPIIDLTFGLSNKLKDRISGPIVLSLIDDSFATSKGLTIRQKGTELRAEYENSVAGFGDSETADVWIKGDTISFKVIGREYDEVLVFDRDENLMKSERFNSRYRILINQLIK